MHCSHAEFWTVSECLQKTGAVAHPLKYDVNATQVLLSPTPPHPEISQWTLCSEDVYVTSLDNYFCPQSSAVATSPICFAICLIDCERFGKG